jgi:hypothetical protein
MRRNAAGWPACCCAHIAHRGMGLLIGLAPAQVWDETTDGGGDAGALPPGQLTWAPVAEPHPGRPGAGRGVGGPLLHLDPRPDELHGELLQRRGRGVGPALALRRRGQRRRARVRRHLALRHRHHAGLGDRDRQPLHRDHAAGRPARRQRGQPDLPDDHLGADGPQPGRRPGRGLGGPALDGPGPYRIVFENASYHMEGDDPGGGDGSASPTAGPGGRTRPPTT